MRLILHAIVLLLLVQMLTAPVIAQETSNSTNGIEHYEDKGPDFRSQGRLWNSWTILLDVAGHASVAENLLEHFEG